MSHSFQIVDGDIALSGSHFSIVEGFDKLQQDLEIWVTFLFGSDRFHPLFGSVLDNFVGNIIDVNNQQEIISEVARILSNYQQLQLSRYQTDPSKFSPEELLNSIDNINATVGYTTITVDVSYTTVAGTSANLQVTTFT